MKRGKRSSLSSDDLKKRKNGVNCGIVVGIIAYVASLIPVFINTSLISRIPLFASITGPMKAVKAVIILVGELIVIIPTALYYYYDYYIKTTGLAREEYYRKPKEIILKVLLPIAGGVIIAGGLLHLVSPSSMLLFDGFNIVGISIWFLKFRH